MSKDSDGAVCDDCGGEGCEGCNCHGFVSHIPNNKRQSVSPTDKNASDLDTAPTSRVD